MCCLGLRTGALLRTQPATSILKPSDLGDYGLNTLTDEPLPSFDRFVLRGSRDRVCTILQCVSVIEDKMVSVYGIQVEPSVVVHMFINDEELENSLIEYCMQGCADDELWSFAAFHRLYDRVLQHYVIEKR